MASNIFGRYVWLIDTLRRNKRLTYDEINQLWQQNGLSYGEGDTLALRTFHNHRKAIADIFNIDIECDTKDGYKYYIAEPEQLESDKLRSWLVDSYSMLNQIQCDKKLEGRIIFENVPSGNTWLMAITDAIRKNRVLEIKYKAFGKPEPNTFEIEPYFLKVSKRRWYVIARSSYYSDLNRRKNEADGGDRKEDVVLVYALDRIINLEDADKDFVMASNFNVNDYFKGCCGIITSKQGPQRVVVKAYHYAADYLRTLPLHESQRELKELEDGEACYFELNVCPTFDFYQSVLSQCDQIEVVEPKSVRNEIRNFVRNLSKMYNNA